MRECKPQSEFRCKFKVAVIGCGNVGATAAYSMLIDGTPTDLALIDIDRDRAEGLELDFSHALSFFPYTNITASDDYADCKDANLVVVTAGARQKEGETRLDLAAKNRAIFKEMIPQIAKAAPEAILLIVTNPVDVLTYDAAKLSGFPPGRVFGTGTMLDSARLRFHIAERLCVSPKSVEAFVLGEHGDSSFPVFSAANVAGKPLMEFEEFPNSAAEESYQETREAAYKIINDLGYTCYSIAIVVREIMLAIYEHSRTVMPVSVPLTGQYGHEGVALSLPCVLDSNGIAEIMEIPLSGLELEQLQNSVNTIKQYLK